MNKDPAAQITDKALFIAHGDSEVLKSRAVKAVVDQRLPEADREFGLIELYVREVDLQQITGSFASGSLFATQQVVVLRDLDDMAKTQQQSLVPALESIGPGITVVMTSSPAPRGRATEPNLSAPLVKLVKASGRIVDCNTPAYLDWKDELTPWVRAEAERHNKRFSDGALQLLIDTVGANCDRLANEIEKLAIYVDKSAEITQEDVRAAASPAQDEDIFGLTDAIGQRDAAAALAALPALLPAHAKSGEGIRVLAMISRHPRLLWQTRHLLKHNVGLLSAQNCPEQIREQLPQQQNIFDAIRGMRPIARKFAQQAKTFSDGQLARAIVEVFNADMALKGQYEQEMDDRMLLETLVIALCRL